MTIMIICTNVILLVFLNIIQRAQSGLGLRQSGDLDDEHPRKYRRCLEDLQEHARVQNTKMEEARTKTCKEIELVCATR